MSDPAMIALISALSGLIGGIVTLIGTVIVERIRSSGQIKLHQIDKEAEAQKTDEEIEKELALSDRAELFKFIDQLRIDDKARDKILEALRNENNDLHMRVALLEHMKEEIETMRKEFEVERRRWDAERLRWDAERIAWARERKSLMDRIAKLEKQIG